MGTNVWRQFLKSICDNSDWKYAVFWKRKYHQNQMVLIWEDGYCDNFKPKRMFGNDDVIHPHFSSGCGVSEHTSNGCPVGLALSEMTCAHYIMGEGLVGEVAHSGTHFWASSKDILVFGNSLPIPELPNEWLPQIEAGIKTILLVAVAPYGVLQLGSLEVVTEDMCHLTRIVGEFNAVQNHVPMFCSSYSNSVAQSTSSLESVLFESSDVSATVTATFPVDLHSEDFLDEIVELPIPMTPSLENRIPHFFSMDDVSLEFGDILSYMPDIYIDEADVPFSLPDGIKEEEWDRYPQHNSSNIAVYNDESAGIISSQIEDLIENLYESYDAGENEFGISTAYELGEALSILQQQNLDDDDDVWETLMPNNDAFTSDTELSAQMVNEWFCQINDAEDPSGAVVVNTCSENDKARNNRNGSSESMLQDSVVPVSPFSLDYTEPDHLWSRVTSVLDYTEPDHLWSRVISVDASGDSRGSSSKISSATTFKTMMDKLTHTKFQNKGFTDEKSSVRSKPLLRKTRDKHIDKQKRRPRDRQLIQDRLKVLRDLVPNGEKFSIDGLLDHTIKHMMLLRKVSDQSRMLKAAYLEVDGKSKLKSSQRKEKTESGASWAAYQVDSEHDVFPIVVEDLDIPGHMLIEILCNDNDLFLEVAQVICGLDLSIVKGGMKTQSNSSWAQFVVETHKNFQRMDFFWPLMQLVQRNPKLILKA